MAVGTATIVGGNTVSLSLNSSEFAAVQQAFNTIGQGFTSSNVLSFGQTATPGDLNVFNGLRAASGPHTGTQAIALTGDASVELSGNTRTELLVGNEGNDTIVAFGGTGSIFAGDGNNQILINQPGVAGGSEYIEIGSGTDSISMWGGAVTVVNTAGGTADIYTNDPTASPNNSITALTGTDVISVGGGSNDTIYLGSGTDTVTGPGSATVFGGSGSLSFTGGSGSDSVVAGSGLATLVAGSGQNIFMAGSGYTTMLAGSGYDTFIGGSGHDSMVGTGAISNLFEFTSTQAGGSHTISGFTEGRDSIELVGYDSATALANATVSNGNTFISLDNGQTTIELKGFVGLKPSDFK